MSAKLPVNIFNVTVEAPEAGKKPDYNASVPKTASTKVVKVEWEGELDENGCFKSNTNYTMYATVHLLDGHKDTKYIKYVEDTVKVNGKIAKLKDISEDKTQAVVYYTFKPGETGTETSGTEEVSKHMHCYCGGYIENTGDHTSHKTVAYKAWPEDGKIKYNNGVAHIYLEQDVLLDSTLKIGNDKTLYLCLNGYALVMKPDGQITKNDPMPTQFADVDRNAYYVEPVKWAVEKNITNGTSDTTFSPGSTCTRGQIVTFLWRAAQKGLI